MTTDAEHGGARIQVIDRAVALLDAIGRYPEPVSLKVLGAETGLHPSTAHRILASLTANGFVERDQSGHYRFGVKLLRLGVRLHADVDMRAAALPVMEALREETGETINLTIREGDEVVYIEKVSPNRSLIAQRLVGTRAPLHVTAVGKLMLAAGGEAAMRAYADRTNLPAFTRNTITDLDGLTQACITALAEGHALDDEEAELGVGCIGVILRDGVGRVAGGLSISAPMHRRQLEWIKPLRAAGDAISGQLGAKAGPPPGAQEA